jgi:hypothetical protein
MTAQRFTPPRAPVGGEELPGPRFDTSDLRRRAAAQQQQRPAAPAPDAGKILAALPRFDGTELRVSLHTHEGKPFVRVGPWQSSAPDAWPVKGKGTTVRVRELAAVAAALLDALDATETPSP